GYSLLPQVLSEPSGLAVSVVEEAAIAIDLGISSFPEDLCPAALIQLGRELSTGCMLDAMYRPQPLLQAAHDYFVSNAAARVVRRKTAVVRRVPILGSDDQFEMRLGGVYSGYDDIAAHDRHGP